MLVDKETHFVNQHHLLKVSYIKKKSLVDNCLNTFARSSSFFC